VSVPWPEPLIVSNPAAGVGIAGSSEQRIEVTLLSAKAPSSRRAAKRRSASFGARHARRKL